MSNYSENKKKRIQEEVERLRNKINPMISGKVIVYHSVSYNFYNHNLKPEENYIILKNPELKIELPYFYFIYENNIKATEFHKIRTMYVNIYQPWDFKNHFFLFDSIEEAKLFIEMKKF